MQFKSKDPSGAPIVAEKIRDKIWIHVGGRTFAVDAVPVSTKRKKSEGAGSLQITAPMPGRVTKILSSPGNKIRKGQSLVVMEAMKMEYTLKSEIDGMIDVVDCIEGEQVALGKILIRLKMP